MNLYKYIVLRTIVETVIVVAAWPLFDLAWWRYAVVVGGLNAIRIFFTKGIAS